MQEAWKGNDEASKHNDILNLFGDLVFSFEQLLTTLQALLVVRIGEAVLYPPISREFFPLELE